MTGTSDWQGWVGRTWADEWRRTDRSFAGLTPHLLAVIAAIPGRQVLDLGCGAGEISLAVAQARPDARVTGIDISSELVAVANQRATDIGAQRVRFANADAGIFRDERAPADLLVSRHGVMFFADPPAVFRHLAHQAAPGAHLVFSCFRERTQNPWAELFDRVLPHAMPVPADSHAAGPFAFADPEHVRCSLAGWGEITFTPVDFTYVAGAGAHPLADAIGFFSRIGPTAARLAGLTAGARSNALAAMANVLEPYCDNGVVALPAAAWIVTAHSDQSDRANRLV